MGEVPDLHRFSTTGGYETNMLLLTLLSLPSAHAGEGLSLADAISTALQSNADLRAAEAALDAADADQLGAKGAFDPVLSVSGGLDRAESRSFLAGYPMASTTRAWSGDLGIAGELPSGTSWSISGEIARDAADTETTFGGASGTQETDYWTSSVGVTVRQDVLALVRPTTAREAVLRAAERADQREMALLQTRQEALAAVATAWWDFQAAGARAHLARTSVESAVALVQVTDAWVQEGQAEAVELARVRTEQLAAEQAAVEAEAEVARSRDRLLVVIGREPGADVTPVGEGAVRTPASMDLKEHLAIADAQSPSIALLDLQLEAARAASRDARYDGLPSLSLTGSVGAGSLESSASDAVGSLVGDESLPSWAAGIEVSVPLGGRVARGTRDAASADVRAAEAALEEAERALAADVREALRDLQTATTALSLAAQRVEVARETEAGERARAEEGMRRLDQLLDAVNAREEAEADVLDARLAASRAIVEVARLEGGVDAAILP